MSKSDGTLSQNKAVIKYLKKHRTLTAMEALAKFKCFRLASRINDLRNYGYIIRTHMIYESNGKRYAKYQYIG